MTNFRSPTARSHNRTPVTIEVMINGVLNFVDGRIASDRRNPHPVTAAPAAVEGP